MHKTPALIQLGRIVGVHGIRGWVKLYSDCRPRDAILDYTSFVATHNSRHLTLKLADGHVQGKGLIAKFEGINDRDAAYSLVGLDLYVNREDMPEPEKGEFYWHDLIGLTIVNQEQETLGTVTNLFETGANDVLVVKDSDNKEHLIPFIIEEVICDIDWDNKILYVDWHSDWRLD